MRLQLGVLLLELLVFVLSSNVRDPLGFFGSGSSLEEFLEVLMLMSQVPALNVSLDSQF
ncbi:hypothetical protein [Streptomyces sp. ISL-94]|uniref:hypothetical protein n=1 Tax=Streptomyces sp. ISL-94 TaxID=2819190 RepID=UPI001BEA97E9|nr:hypothetical protein [Streptomyces sp. ISL-94]MBT2480773.1 hypothetical protein [Streptomyces sp. ISL-94]